MADYARRGSEQAIANVMAALKAGVSAVLLANHGVLVFYRTPELATMVGGVVEEPAQASVNASGIGGPIPLPEELKNAAHQRAMAFESHWTAEA